MEDLIRRLCVIANDPAVATDWRHESGAPDMPDWRQPRTALPPLTPAQVDAADRSLGLRLPPLLRAVYVQVGNGNFGPGFGLFPLACSDPELSPWGTVVALYSAA